MLVIREVGKDKPKNVKTIGAKVIEEQTNELDYLVEGVSIQPLEAFKTKDELEAYGLTYGIDLNKSKTMKNMYADLVEHTKK